MPYLALTQEEQHDMLAATLLTQERDLYIHTVNEERYTLILTDKKFDRTSDFGKRILKLLQETRARKQEVEYILAALVQQLPEASILVQALDRLHRIRLTKSAS